MSTGQRPGGLTALAVLNFVFGGLGAISMLILFAAVGAVDSASGGEATRKAAGTPEGALGMVWLLLGLAIAVLLIVSGVGYLGQKRFLGRTMGNAYAACSLANTAIGIGLVGFGFMSIIGLVYPVLTLALVNGTFKEDLVQ